MPLHSNCGQLEIRLGEEGFIFREDRQSRNRRPSDLAQRTQRHGAHREKRQPEPRKLIRTGVSLFYSSSKGRRDPSLTIFARDADPDRIVEWTGGMIPET